MEMSVIQIKVWIGDLYIANKMLEEQVAILSKDNHGLKEELKKLKQDQDNDDQL